MGTRTKKYNLTLPISAGLLAALCLVSGLFFFSASAYAAKTIEETCKTKFTPCKIKGYNEYAKAHYSPNQVQGLQSGCLNVIPISTYTRVSEEACHRKTSCSSSSSTKVQYSDGTCYRQHQGMDVGAPVGTLVTSAAKGVVVRVTTCMEGGGRAVIMRHKKADGKGCYTTTYMHLSAIMDTAQKYAGSGLELPKGSVIGKVGRSSCNNKELIENAYNPHLHIEVRDDPKCIGERGTIFNPQCPQLQAFCKDDVNEAPILDEKPMEGGYVNLTSHVESSATLTGCGKMYSDDITELHQYSESGGNPASYGCYATGCSFGLSGMSCPSGTMHKYLEQMPKELFAKLQIGGSLQSTIEAACGSSPPGEGYKSTPPTSEFIEKWKALAASDTSSFIQSQKAFILKEFSMILNQDMLESGAKGITMEQLEKRSPEIQMALLSARIASGPAGPRKMINFMFANGGSLYGKKLSDVSDKEFLEAYYQVFHRLWDNAKGRDKIIKGIMNREAREKAELLESLAIREEMAKGKTLEEASQAVTGKRACAEGEYPVAKVTTAVVSGYGGGGGGYGGSSGFDSEYDGPHDCSISNYRNSFNSCIFCDIFGTLFNTASAVAKKSFNALANGVMMLVCVGFALWLGLTVLKFVSAMEQKNPSILIKTILNKAFLILIVVTLLRMDSSSFFKLAMEPLFNTGFKMAQMVNAGVEGETCKNTYHILTEAQGAGLPESMGVSILCTIETIQGKILDVMALGSTSLCVACYIKSWKHIPIFPDLAYFLTGLFLWIAAILLMVIYPFLLIDSVLQLCVATALLPAAIGSYAFDFTKKYSGKIWDVFLNCMFNFLFLSIIIFILTNGLNNILPTGEIFEAGSGTRYEIIIEELPWWSPRFIQVIFYMILGWAVLGEANSFAGNFAKSIGIKGIGSKVGGLAANVANRTVTGAGKGAFKATKAVGGKVMERGREAYSHFKTRRRANKIERSSNTVVDADGNKSLRHRTWYGRTVTDTLQTAPDGTRTVTRTKQSIFGGKAKSVANDKFISNKRSYDKNGNLIKEEFSMNTAAGKTLLNRDGTRNEVAIHAIRSGSGMSNDDVDKAVMQQMMQERMGGVPGASLNEEFRERNVSRGLDGNGREVFTVTQTNTDGSTSIFQMTKGDKRDMLTVTHISKNGRAQSYASDGIINKKSSYKVGANGEIDAQSVKNNYAFAKNFNSAHTRSMDSNGRMNRNIPADQIMMSDEDMRLFREQVATYGKDQPMAEFGK